MFRRIKFPSVSQIDKKDCGAACLATISKFYGRSLDLHDIKKHTGESKQGVSISAIIKAAEHFGYNALSFSSSYKWLKEKTLLPCIVHWQNSHFIVVYKVTGKNVYISDPAVGCTYKLSKSEFVNGWLGHIKEKKSWKKGVILCLEPKNEFYDNYSKKESFIQVIKFLWNEIRYYKKELLKILIVSILITISASIIPFLTKSLIDNALPGNNLNLIGILLIAQIALIFFTAFGNWISEAINLYLSIKVKINILTSFFTKLVNLPLSYFENKIFGDILQRTFDYDRIEEFLIRSIFSILSSISLFVILSFVLFYYNHLLFWIHIVGSSCYILWTILFWSIRKRMDIQYFSVVAKNHSHWIETFTNIQEIKTYSIQDVKRKKWQNIQIKLYEVSLKMLNVGQIQQLGSTLIDGIKNTAIIYYSAYLLLNDNLTFGILIAIQYIIGQLNRPLKEIVTFIERWQMAYISYVRINEVNKIDPEGHDNYLNINNTKGDIVLENLVFTYDKEKLIIKNLNVTFEQGKITHIKGKSGSGKTTLLKLISGLYQPQRGKIFINGNDLHFIDLKVWRSKYSLVTPESNLFSGNILENIVFEEAYDEDKFNKVCIITGVDLLAQNMKSGFFTKIGEEGKALSSGEQQRIILARSLYKENIEFLLLDEATSHLDEQSEHDILTNIKLYFNQLTIIMVSHRKELSKIADHCYELNTANSPKKLTR